MAAVQMKKILVAVDLSEPNSTVAAQVADHAVCLAKALDAEILVVHVAAILLPYYGRTKVPDSALETFKTEILDGAERAMDEFVKKFQGFKVKGQVISGNAADEILNQAKDSHADLIVIGTHSRGELERFFFGSVAEKVVKKAPVPVLTVRAAWPASA